ncbi:MAG: PilW family protein [Proteobacteria bacterium]|nr:PilW family protein [Pseudomonadota bacterium]
MNTPPAAARAHRAHGMTLIELMVALTVGMFLSLAAFGVLQVAEGRKRSLTAVNDINQSGSYALYLIDKWVRSAGNGFVQTASFGYGCALYAATSSSGTQTQVLPRTTAFPSPFDTVVSGVSGTLRLAPVLILPDQTTPGVSGHTSDALVVMAGTSGTSNVLSLFSGFAASGASGSGTISLVNTVGFNASDLVLVADQQSTSGGGPANCMIQQVASGFSGGTATTLNLSGSYSTNTVDTQSLTDFTETSVAIDLGNGTNSPPQFQLIGVGDNNTLYTYDLLQTQSTPLQQVADGVFELHALYGIDTNNDGKISDSEWFSPTATGYTPSDLMNGSESANSVLQKIKAIRVGLILRTALPEKAGSAQAPTATSITLFDDLSSLSYTRTFSSAEQLYRYRKLELTIPLRNNLLLN